MQAYLHALPSTPSDDCFQNPHAAYSQAAFVCNIRMLLIDAAWRRNSSSSVGSTLAPVSCHASPQAASTSIPTRDPLYCRTTASPQATCTCFCSMTRRAPRARRWPPSAVPTQPRQQPLCSDVLQLTSKAIQLSSYCLAISPIDFHTDSSTFCFRTFYSRQSRSTFYLRTTALP